MSSLPLLLFFLPFTWGRHRRARATTALPRATSLELLILFAKTHLNYPFRPVLRDFKRFFVIWGFYRPIFTPFLASRKVWLV
jgi:hypothetical protein